MPKIIIDQTKLITSADKFAQRKAEKISSIKLAGDAILQGGFPYDFGNPYGVQHLQLRNNTDRTNWLTAMAGYQIQIQMGHGWMVGASFRTAENETINLSFDEAVAALVQMIGWADQLYRVSWAKQDEARAATNDAELDAVSLESWFD